MKRLVVTWLKSESPLMWYSWVGYLVAGAALVLGIAGFILFWMGACVGIFALNQEPPVPPDFLALWLLALLLLGVAVGLLVLVDTRLMTSHFEKKPGQ